MIEDFAAPYSYVKDPGKRKNKTIRIILIFFMLGVCSYFVINMNSPVQDNRVVAGSSTEKPEFSQPTIVIAEEGPEIAIENAIGKSEAIFGVVIVDLNTDKFYVKNEHRIFTSASLYKLWVLASSLELLETNKLSLNSVLRANNTELYKRFNLASPSAELELEYSVENALERMITVSDNDSALLLSSRIGLANVKTFLERENMINSKLGTGGDYPTTTAYDTAVFLKKIYEGSLVSPDASDTMMDLLKRQRLNNKLPKYLPEHTVIAHKTGELDEFTHDAGIVFTPKGDYIIVILSESPKNAKISDTEDVIGRISEAVYNYFLTD